MSTKLVSEEYAESTYAKLSDLPAGAVVVDYGDTTKHSSIYAALQSKSPLFVCRQDMMNCIYIPAVYSSVFSSTDFTVDFLSADHRTSYNGSTDTWGNLTAYTSLTTSNLVNSKSSSTSGAYTCKYSNDTFLSISDLKSSFTGSTTSAYTCTAANTIFAKATDVPKIEKILVSVFNVPSASFDTSDFTYIEAECFIGSTPHYCQFSPVLADNWTNATLAIAIPAPYPSPDWTPTVLMRTTPDASPSVSTPEYAGYTNLEGRSWHVFKLALSSVNAATRLDVKCEK